MNKKETEKKAENLMMDFRAIEIEDIEGKKIKYDISRELGKHMFENAVDPADLNLGKEIYAKGEVEMNAPRAAIVKKYVDSGFKAFVKVVLDPALDIIINNKNK